MFDRFMSIAADQGRKDIKSNGGDEFTLLLLLIAGGAYATEPANTTEQVKKSETVGNKICPVSGDKIDERTKETYEYKGRIYSFCCPDCVEEFKKDPEKYIERLKKSKESEQEHSTQGEHQHHNDAK